MTVETDALKVATAFSGWFTFGDAPGQAPPNRKQAMVVLLTQFPVVILELLYVSRLLQPLNLAVATFIGNLLSVAALTWLVVPWANRAFDWWTRPTSSVSPRVEAAGIALIVGLHAISVVVFA